MKVKQRITYAVNSKAVTEERMLPVTLEADEPRHLESGVINVYPELQYQEIEGFGGAITDTVGYLYSTLKKREKKRFLEDYFGPDGQHYRFIRMHMDSCDYSLEEYQAVKDPIADPDLATFTIKRDRKYMLPMLKDAMAMTALPFSVLLSPWSPPWQWKTPPERPKNDGAVYGELPGKPEEVDYENPSRNNGGSLKKEYYGSWARYLAKYVQAYLDEGVPVTMMTLQNESIAATNWDSCIWTPEDQKEFLRDHLYPTFKEAGLLSKVGLYIWDHNKERVAEYASGVLDEETINMVEGIAFHWYSGDHFEALSIAHELFPELKLILSECCPLHAPGKTGMGGFTFPGAPSVAEVDLADAAAYAHDIIGNLNHGMSRWIDWNLCVDKDGGPRHVPMGFGAPVCVNPDGTYRKLVLFDYVGHFSKFILPGARRIAFSRCDDKVDVTAAMNRDGSIVLVALNRAPKDASYAIRMDGQVIRFDVPGNTITTLYMVEE